MNGAAGSPAPDSYSISGAVRPASIGAGATLTLSGPSSAEVVADGAGAYSFKSLTKGNYLVTPSAQGLAFSPANQTAAIATGDVLGLDFSACSGACAAPLFADEFNDPSLGPAWITMNRHGDYGNNELQCYVPGNVSILTGQLQIDSRLQAQTCGDANHAAAAWNYTSAMVQWKTLNFTYGTLEFKAQLAGGKGTWAAVWLLGANCQGANVVGADNSGKCKWPDAGSDEIDITEVLNGDYTHVNQQVHSGSNNNGCSAPTSDVTKNSHVYQLVWSTTSLIWKIDGTETCRLTSGIPSTPMFVIINAALGGAGGAVTDSTLPQTTRVDYIRLTQP
jgi:beta-glucanase (GH16 family)